MRTLLLATLFALAAAPARAEWAKRGAENGKFLVDVSAPDYAHVYTAGFEITGSGFSTSARTIVRASSDSGATFTDISGALSETPSREEIATAIAFPAPQHGFVAIGHHVARTSDAGGSWTKADVGFGVNALAFRDAEHGLAVGADGRIARTTDGGATWSAATSPVSTTLRHVLFLDATHAFASGHELEQDTNHPSGGVLLSSSDGGATWTKGAEVANQGISSMFFLCDGKTGWIAAFRWDSSSGYLATLFSTTDGGATLTDVQLPRDAGKVTGFGTSQTLQTGKILAQWWDDAHHGHLGGLAYVGSMEQGQSGSGGSSTSQKKDLWRVVDYATADGTTWDHTNLGTITISLSGAPSDGDFQAGLFRDFERGWMVGTDGVVFGYDHACSADADCATGYGCWRTRCLKKGSPFCGTDPGTGDPGSSGNGADGGSAADHESLDQVGDGCGCDAGGTISAFALLALVARRRARR